MNGDALVCRARCVRPIEVVCEDATVTRQAYSIVQNALLSGVNWEVENFPQSIYGAVVSYSEKQFGFSIADPAVRSAIQGANFRRPKRHSERISMVLGRDLGSSPRDLVEELSRESIGCQTSLYDRLAKLSDIGLRRDDTQHSEIAYFVLSLTVHSIFLVSRTSARSDIADKVSLRVLKINSESDDGGPSLRERVNAFQQRFRIYRSALLQMTTGQDSPKDSQFEFGRLLSRNLIGRESAVVGTFLYGAASAILEESGKIITEIERV